MGGVCNHIFHDLKEHWQTPFGLGSTPLITVDGYRHGPIPNNIGCAGDEPFVTHPCYIEKGSMISKLSPESFK